MMIARVFPKDEAKRALGDFVPVYIDSEKQRALASKYEIRAFPTFVCMDSGGEEVDRHVGSGDLAKFTDLLASFSQSAKDAADESASE